MTQTIVFSTKVVGAVLKVFKSGFPGVELSDIATPLIGMQEMT